mgnify:CR=1 FL=1
MTWTVDRLKKVRAELFDLAFKERAQSLGRGLHPNEALSLVSEVERLTAEIDRLTARLQTAEKAAHEWRERAEGKEDGTRCKSCGGGLDGPGWDCQWCGERAGA